MRPPLHLNGLRAFEAVGRHGSVKEAARELRVTPSAVSHQVRLLEEMLGMHLFDRRGRSITLTPYGAQLLPKLGAGFALINEALVDHHGRTAAGPLRLSVLETFALYWLLPRLQRYPLVQRGFELDISATQRLVSFETEHVDLAIRSGHGDWPGLEAELLLTERLGIYGPSGVDDAPILFLSRHRIAEWERWRPHVRHAAASARMMLVNSSSLAIKAAVDGAGLCLAGDIFVQSEVDAGRLQLREQSPAKSSMGGYWLVHRVASRRDPRIRNFRRWLARETASDRAAA